LLVVFLLVAACGDDDDDGASTDGGNASPTEASGATAEGGGEEEAMLELDGVSLTVSGKEFTEQLILGQILVKALENAGADVDDQTAIFGSENTRTALESGDVDMYWEYTGTAWSVHLGREIGEAPGDPVELYEAVKAGDLEENGVVWMDMTEVNNPYALGILRSRAEEMGVSTISDYAEIANTNPEDATLCGATEWLTRDDGFPALAADYSFELANEYLAEVEFSIIPSLVVEGDTCNFGEFFGTDGTIAANDILILEDDLNSFFAYNNALTVRQDVYEEHSEALEAIFGPISAALTSEVMRELNSRVDADGEEPAAVAEDWLQENGFIS
jgi:osmoprotectant transport system substrate-binding protein